jgi:hypothetical protein
MCGAGLGRSRAHRVYRANPGGMADDPETLTVRPTVIAGRRYADDYQVRWRGLPIGRIMLGSGAPHGRLP